MSHLVVSAVGADRPGIVAAVTGALMAAGCNLEDTSMTILRGNFAMMLVVAAPGGTTADAIRAALDGPAAALDLVLTVRALPDVAPTVAEGDHWTVSVYGADRPGIVHAVTLVLADLGINVTDLRTNVIGDPDRPVYAMLLDVTLPSSADGASVERRLRELGATLGVECSMHPDEADIL